MATFDQVQKRAERAFNRRNLWLSVWDEMVELSMPGREGFFENDPGQERMDNIFDETAIISVDEFVANLDAALTPEGLDLVRFEPGIDVPPEQIEAMQRDLDEVSRLVNLEISAQNFATVNQELYLDLAIGTTSTIIEDHGPGEGIKHEAVPLKSYAIDKGPDGMPDGRFRHVLIAVGSIATRWPKATLTKDLRELIGTDPEKEVTLLETVWRDWGNKDEESYIYHLAYPDEKEILLIATYEGEGSCPWVTARWSRAAGEWWGRGPLFRALPAIRLANMMEEYGLENAEMALAGLYQADDDGTVNVRTINVEPGTVVPVRPNSNGIRPIVRSHEFDLSAFSLAEVKSNIRKALFTEDLGAREGTPVSATEINARRGRVLRQLSSFYPSLKRELLDQRVRRVVYLMKQQGRIELPKLNGRAIKIMYNSPLARAQNQQNVNDLLGYTQTMRQILGPRESMMYMNAVRTAEKIRQYFGVSTVFTNSKKEQQQLQQQLAMAAQAAEKASPGSGQAVFEGLGSDAETIQ